jgi:hypothetical protein
MRFGCIITAVLLGLGLQFPAFAGDKDPLDRLDPEVLLKGAVSERDVSLLFAYLRSALLAAVEGREAPAPEELQRRAETLGNELKLRSALAAWVLLDALEVTANEALRGPPAPRLALPPITPFTPIRD